ncbi:glycosyltransferase family 39 protein [Periweissella beninensis]|uniref:glycosyltransferase family 39 protein n=1 Tax=Periweissella beninensis TaxID=504936 RepID=UPI0021A3E795|nr:glycosyltransferase family 39 protein [Periweissella beninensis]MCT4396083.1 phospholipid carrier-dependent glycosyltransferase [Periweissella beninensis]
MREKFKNIKVDKWLLAILALAAILYGWGTWDAGNANSFYTSAITSMLQSWSNFWYGAFDPAGFITVDKPPVALWFMAISAKIFGLHGWSIVLPSVLAGIGSVYLLYRLIAPKFGAFAGRLAALFMTLTPIVVADSRTNNMDAILVFTLLLAIYFLQKAVNQNKFWQVLIAFGLIGVGFNIKMLQAFMILPAMVVYYWLSVKKPFKRKLGWFIGGVASLAIFTLAYPVAVDSVSKDRRPYIGSSQTNSLLELAFGYNGTERLLGQSTGTGGAFAGMNSTTKKSQQKNTKGQMPSGQKNSKRTKNGQQNMTPPTGKTAKATGQAGGNRSRQNMPTGKNGQKARNNIQAKGTKKVGKTNNMTPPTGTRGNKKGSMSMGGGNNAFAIGTAGPLRLLQQDLGSQIGWFIPLSLIGMLIGLLGYRDRKKKWYYLTSEQKEVVLWAGWLVPVASFFSVAGFFHPYYTIMLAPAIAALSAIGLAYLKQQQEQAKDGKMHRWVGSLWAICLLATTGIQAYYAWSYYPTASVALLAVGAALAVWWVIDNRPVRHRIAVSLITLVAMASWWAATPTIAHESAAIPSAGPSLLTSQGSQDLGGEVNTSILKYVTKHQGNAKYLFTTSDSNSASGYIIKSKKAVMALGGYNGTDPTMTLNQFKKLVKSGQVKYFLSSGDKGGSGQIGKIITWIKKHGTKVKLSGTQTNSTSSTQSFGGGMGGNNSSTLYDLTNIYSK